MLLRLAMGAAPASRRLATRQVASCVVRPAQQRLALPGCRTASQIAARGQGRGILHPVKGARGAATQLGAYLEQCGAVWGDAPEIAEVQSSNNGRTFSWHVNLPPEQLKALRQGDSVESPPFSIGEKGRARFQVYPKGDTDCNAEGVCSFWLWTDQKDIGPVRLRLGSGEHAVESKFGASEFCRLEDALHNGALEVGLCLEADPAGPAAVSAEQPNVAQSLQLTGLQLCEWRVFQMQSLLEKTDLVTSPPFRFHHVLLGDMYLELLLNAPHNGFCTLFFRCRVPTMKLRVSLNVGDTFMKSFISHGHSTREEDFKLDTCLQVNLDVPDVLGPDGELTVRCAMEEVVSLPAALREMIPKLDERAQWPKRL
mmetsp:Transcript_32013/g.56624  ORF Transcript_32013/g.56624 Transcript_32013/m.56624 type:complete len:369 (+) Transcript_32013:111-1217(+)